MNNIFLKKAIILLITLAVFSCNSNKVDKKAQELKREMKGQLSSLNSAAYFKDKAVRSFLKEDFENFYKNRKYRLAWIKSNEILPQADSLVKAIEYSYEEGLDPANYKLDEITALRQELFANQPKNIRKIKRDSVSIQKLVQLDFLMTSSYMTYGAHLLSGRIDPYKLDSLWIVHPRKKDLATHLEDAIKNKQIRNSLNELSPAVNQYKLMKRQLANYRKVMKQGGWPLLTSENVNKNGVKGETAQKLRQRLALSGELDTIQAATSGEGKQLEEAIKMFQQRHGVTPDGRLTAETLKWINMPVEEVVQLLELNMERIRWLPDSIGNTYLLVNTPEYVLKAYNGGKKNLQMNVIVGEEYASTPVFTDTLEYLVFNPDWIVPPSIAKNEILPILQQNPDYLLSHNMAVYETWNEKDTMALDPFTTDWLQFTPETFNYRIVQKPGPDNPLGEVKFMLPNDLYIYLHDTPSDHLFKRKDKRLSHGCIRLEKPMELAKYLLSADDEKLKQYTEKEEPEVVKLSKKMPVQIVYRTVWVDEQNLLNFRSDIYGHDKVQRRAITNKENQLSKL